MECDDNGGSHWMERMNCDDFNATCREGEFTKYYLYGSTMNEENTHGCSVDTLSCDGDTEQYCAENNQYVIGCSYSHGPAAMVIAENDKGYPYCVEKSDGTVEFAWADGECNEGESICSNAFSVKECGNGVWDGGGYACSQDHNQICAQSTDTDESPSAECVNADPCNEQTGEYNICKTDLDILHCLFSETNGWYWGRAICPDSKSCYIDTLGYARCE